jgi:hypothetical protein
MKTQMTRVSGAEVCCIVAFWNDRLDGQYRRELSTADQSCLQWLLRGAC